MKIPITLISEKYATPNLTNSKVGIVRFVDPVIHRTRDHTYLNLYDSIDGVTRSSSIECDDNLSFDNQLMTYNFLGTSLVYRFESQEDIKQISSLFE
jgi:hypothetical protein